MADGPKISIFLSDALQQRLIELRVEAKQTAKEVRQATKQAENELKETGKIAEETLKKLTAAENKQANIKAEQKGLKSQQRDPSGSTHDGGSTPSSSEPRKTGAGKGRTPLSEGVWKWLQDGKDPGSQSDPMMSLIRSVRSSHGGALRTAEGALSGSPNAMMSIMNRIGIGGPIAAGVLAGAVIASEIANIHSQDSARAEGVNLQSASYTAALARSLRYSDGSQTAAFLDSIRGAGRDPNVHANSMNPFTVFSPREELTAEAREYQKHAVDFVLNVGKKMTNEQKAQFIDPKSFINDPNVQRQFSWRNAVDGKEGFQFLGASMAWAGGRIKGWFTGENEKEEIAASMAYGKKVMANAEKQRNESTKMFYDQNPNALVARMDAENQQLAYRKFQMERFCDWNEY